MFFGKMLHAALQHQAKRVKTSRLASDQFFNLVPVANLDMRQNLCLFTNFNR